MNCIVIHYGEIGLKKTNRPFFEKKLVENIRKRGLDARREFGRIVAGYRKGFSKILKTIPGIAYFAPAEMVEPDMDSIIKKAKELVKKGPFRISARRSNKKFRYTSMEINRMVGDAINLKVDLTHPKTELFIEIGENHAYLYVKKYKGLGGLPVGVTGKLISLVSGGIDSPVASYEMIRRGCEIILLHFYNNTQGLKSKITELAKKLAAYQGRIKLIIVPFLPVQQKVIMHIPAEIRMIVYRRLMLMIGEKVLKKEGALGFVTGDNAAQVASQTLENLRVIWSATRENIYAPLIGYDKQGIINIAKKIGTYQTSIIPYSDCCSYLVARHPETRATIKEVRKFEKNLEIRKLVNDSFKNREEIIIS